MGACARRRLTALAALSLSLSLSAASARLTFLMASDTHFGHDVVDTGNNNVSVTALQLNIAAVQEMNACSNGSVSWPASMGGGVVGEPEGLIITGDLIDNGSTEWNQVRGEELELTDRADLQPAPEPCR
jgi:hypothetical protein